MAKKGEKKAHSLKPKKLSNREIELAILENFVGLQKAITDLSVKFDSLSTNMSSLLELFEEAAKGYVKKQDVGLIEQPNPAEDKELIRKLDTLLDQNKTIATGLTLIEEKIRHKISTDETISRNEENPFGLAGRPRPRPLPKV